MAHGRTAVHARIFPSFLVRRLANPVETSVGSVWPKELLDWQAPHLLEQQEREGLRRVLVRRLHPRMQQMRALPVQVKLPPNWQSCLEGLPKHRFKNVVAALAGAPLEEASLDFVKRAMKMALAEVIGALAELEAAHWSAGTITPPDEILPGDALGEEAGSATQCDASGALRAEDLELLREAAALGWPGEVRHDDLRFGFLAEDDATGDPHVSLGAWIACAMTRGRAPARLLDLARECLAADRMTAAQEALAVIRAAAEISAPRRPGAHDRWVAVCHARYVVPVGEGPTLQEVGDQFGVTRERVRQICDEMLAPIGEHSVATPVLRRTLAAAAADAPASVAHVEHSCRSLLGDGFGIEALIAWASVVRAPSPVACQRLRRRPDKAETEGQATAGADYGEIAMVDRVDAPSWLPGFFRRASRDAAVFGCTNVLRLAGLMALHEGIALGERAIRATLEQTPDMRWLDEETGWFALGDTSSCAAASRIRKLLAVADDHVGTDEIVAMLAGDDNFLYRDERRLGMATPPIHVMRELLRGWSWLRLVQRGRFEPIHEIDLSEVLTDTERAGVELVASRGGIAGRFEFVQRLCGEGGVSLVMITALLGSSPVFQRVEHGLYRVRGRAVDDDALAAARQRLAAASSGHSTVSDERANVFYARVTAASLRNEQYSVPRRLQTALAGKRLPLVDVAGGVLGEVRITASGALAGVNLHFPAARPGDLIRLELGESAIAARLVAREATGEASDD